MNRVPHIHSTNAAQHADGRLFSSARARGRPAAILVGIAGSTRGKHLPVDKELFRIGANPENDLVIQGDMPSRQRMPTLISLEKGDHELPTTRGCGQLEVA